MIEQGVIFNSNGKQLVAIEHLPEPSHQRQTKKGVIIVVGGPQTRVGSHRLFVDLARALANEGIAVFRFDYSGAGDSEGVVSTFTKIQEDIDAAIKTFQQRHSDINELTLWGLCDAASAILLYLNENPQQANIKHLFLVNPWVRQVHTQAKTYLRSYYIKRFLSTAFWKKLLSGKVKAKSVFTEVQGFHQQSQENIDTQDNFVTQMLQGLNKFSGQCELLLSGNDLTADEFRLLVKSNKHWRGVTARDTIHMKIIHQADHTFSQRDKKSQLIKLVCKVLMR
ncbi:hydrolase 1, exosortase A system-associated [Colwellia sp. 12G3]|uniref:hydrolase 1, exosortase A system-associated n=1 Tax=Colwellia sp. 12G3 TaxID=2058299 RepID=UPI000C33C087|nr:hydrolase 1, exosortase A system-associated [Colwellia sp. 12G3]PKI17790.1 hydrolase 1, exosortase A system-associated [Colwellia sp. 12G3]